MTSTIFENQLYYKHNPNQGDYKCNVVTVMDMATTRWAVRKLWKRLLPPYPSGRSGSRWITKTLITEAVFGEPSGILTGHARNMKLWRYGNKSKSVAEK